MKKYFSVDIEATGPTPGLHSMISLGACVVGEKENSFYMELKPLNQNYVREAMEIASLGLKCTKQNEETDPRTSTFKPEEVLKELDKRGLSPKEAMNEFDNWVRKSSEGYEPVFLAVPVVFDGMFVFWYYDNFVDKPNPFGHSGEDIRSFYRGLERDLNVGLDKLAMRNGEMTHNALEDAIVHAIEFEEMLRKFNIHI